MSSSIIKGLSFLLLTGITSSVTAQHTKENHLNDTLPGKTLENIIINAKLKASNSAYMPDIVGNSVYAGKRTNTLKLSPGTMGLPLNLGRTVLAKIPGLTMWEMDGTGTQLNIGSRGTDPHRSIEMNMRQNGYNTNSDMFGYPENHYSVPLQGVEEIQLVRGSAALQFGPQFGGMMNYKMKSGDSTRPVAIENEQTAGAYNFFNSFNSIGGTKGKLDYYAFYDYRHGDGWRDNANFNYHSWYAHAGYQLTRKLNIAAEFSHMDYVQQIAGGLTDAQFHARASQSVRSRNYFQPVINIPALIMQYNVSPSTHIEVKANALKGQRNSVQFINPANILDTFNTALGSFNPRQVDRDYYNGFTTEARILHLYHVGKMSSVLSGGVRYSTELTKRKQKGVGTTGDDFDLTLVRPYGIDLRLKTHNYAVFAENILQVTSKFSVTPGIRYENIQTDLTGVINNATAAIAYKGKRSFPLIGAGLQYEVTSAMQLYGNVSQAYRPYLYANVTPADRLDKIDPSLKDSKGYNIDLGYRGHIKDVFQFDINAFYLYYGNKIGLVSITPTGGGAPFLYTTNIGNSVAKGVEAFLEVSLFKLSDQRHNNVEWKIFNSLAYDNAKYTSASINNGGVLKEIDGNYVENAPVWTEKCGTDFRYKNISTGIQFSYTSKNYNDALNTVSSSNGVTGMIPAYHVWDWNIKWQMAKQYFISAAVNNITDEQYFNRRITFYPGPGILPVDGRTFYVSFGLKL
ncbi:MAG: TonB-dependent receptor [Chitinophagaceae bacterium]